MSKHIHKLSNTNQDALTADCAVCGNTIKVRYTGKTAKGSKIHRCINSINDAWKRKRLVYECREKAKESSRASYQNNREKVLRRIKLYTRTPRGKAIQLWHSLVQRAENKSGRHPSYANVKLLLTQKEFLVWAIPQVEQWIVKGKDLIGRTSISVDRINNDGHYELSNIQMLERNKNTGKSNILRWKKFRNSLTS